MVRIINFLSFYNRYLSVYITYVPQIFVNLFLLISTSINFNSVYIEIDGSATLSNYELRLAVSYKVDIKLSELSFYGNFPHSLIFNSLKITGFCLVCLIDFYTQSTNHRYRWRWITLTLRHGAKCLTIGNSWNCSKIWAWEMIIICLIRPRF